MGGDTHTHTHNLQPAKKVGEDIAKFTKNYAGLRVTVKLSIQNRQAEVEIMPTASTLIIGALKEPKRDRKKTKNSSVSCSPLFLSTCRHSVVSFLSVFFFSVVCVVGCFFEGTDMLVPVCVCVCVCVCFVCMCTCDCL